MKRVETAGIVFVLGNAACDRGPEPLRGKRVRPFNIIPQQSQYREDGSVSAEHIEFAKELRYEDVIRRLAQAARKQTEHIFE